MSTHRVLFNLFLVGNILFAVWNAINGYWVIAILNTLVASYMIYERITSMRAGVP